jgi:hypothetical protein
MIRWAFWVIALAFAIWMVAALWAGKSGGEPTPTESGPEPTTPPAVDTTAKDDKIRRLQGELRVERRAARRQLYGMRMTLLHRPSIGEAIELGCATFGSCPTLWRRARCESTLNPYAANASGATGLYQFLASTWRSTPFARFSIYSPYAQALAAGWMIRAGRGSEWACR